MVRLLSKMVFWLCSLYLLLAPPVMLWLLVKIDTFRLLMQGFFTAKEIQWETVGDGQLYALWGFKSVYMAVTYLMLLFLRRSFRSLANGEWFDLRISRYLRSAAALMLVEALFSPVYRTVANLLLTMHQPPGERLLLVGAGLGEFRMIASGLVLWVLADLLVKGMEAENENRQFI